MDQTIVDYLQGLHAGHNKSSFGELVWECYLFLEPDNAGKIEGQALFLSPDVDPDSAVPFEVRGEWVEDFKDVIVNKPFTGLLLRFYECKELGNDSAIAKALAKMNFYPKLVQEQDPFRFIRSYLKINLVDEKITGNSFLFFSREDLEDYQEELEADLELMEFKKLTR